MHSLRSIDLRMQCDLMGSQRQKYLIAFAHLVYSALQYVQIHLDLSKLNCDLAAEADEKCWGAVGSRKPY